jgi:hypothetical protein
MATPPSLPEYGTATATAYTITQPGGLVVPPGWTVVLKSPASQQSDGFSAVALKDPNGNVIIANEGTLPGLGTYGIGSLSADSQIATGQTPQALADATNFAQQVQLATGSSSIYVTGHSLGGTEAQAECQILGSDCAGGATFGATGLPGNTEAGPSSLVNYVDYGDPVGNYASDPSSPLSSIVPSDMNHFGAVVMTGSPSAAAPLQDAAAQISAALTDGDSGSSFGEGQSASQVLAGMADIVGNLGNHSRANYGSDLGISSLTPATAPSTTISGPDVLGTLMRIFGLPFGEEGVENSENAAPGSTNGILNSPDVDISYNSTTNQVTIGQLTSVTTESGAVQAAGVAIIAGDAANDTAATVGGPNASSATIDLSNNVFDIATTGGGGVINLAGTGTQATVDGTGNSITLDGPSQQITTSNGNITLNNDDQNELLVGNGDTVDMGSGDVLAILGSTDTVNSNNNYIYLEGSGTQVTVNGSGNGGALLGSDEKLFATDVNVSLGSYQTADTVVGNDDSVTAGYGDTLGVQGTGESVYSYSNIIDLGGSGTQATILGFGNTVNVSQSGDSITSSDGSDGIDLIGSGLQLTISGGGDSLTSNDNNVVFDGSGQQLTIDGSGNTVSSSDDTIELDGSSSELTIDGSDNTVVSTDDTLSVDDSGSQLTIDGSGNMVGLTGGSADVFTSNDNTFNISNFGGAGLTVDGVGNTVNIANDSESALRINGSENTVGLDGGSVDSITSTDNTVNINDSESQLTIAGSGNTVGVIGASTGAITSTDNTIGISNYSGTQLSINGRGNTVSVAGGNVNTLTAADNTVTINDGGSQLTIDGSSNNVVIGPTVVNNVDLLNSTGNSVDFFDEGTSNLTIDGSTNTVAVSVASITSTDNTINSVGSALTISGSDNTVNAQSDATINSNNNFVNAAGFDSTVTVDGTDNTVGFLGSDLTVNASNTTVDLSDESVGSTINGNDNTIEGPGPGPDVARGLVVDGTGIIDDSVADIFLVGSDRTLQANDPGLLVNGGGQIVLDGSGDNVVGNGNSFILYNTGETATVGGNGDIVLLGNDETLTVNSASGTSENVAVHGQGDTVIFTGHDQQDTIGGTTNFVLEETGSGQPSENDGGYVNIDVDVDGGGGYTGPEPATISGIQVAGVKTVGGSITDISDGDDAGVDLATSSSDIGHPGDVVVGEGDTDVYEGGADPIQIQTSSDSSSTNSATLVSSLTASEPVSDLAGKVGRQSTALVPDTLNELTTGRFLVERTAMPDAEKGVSEIGTTRNVAPIQSSSLPAVGKEDLWSTTLQSTTHNLIHAMATYAPQSSADIHLLAAQNDSHFRDLSLVANALH